MKPARACQEAPDELGGRRGWGAIVPPSARPSQRIATRTATRPYLLIVQRERRLPTNPLGTTSMACRAGISISPEPESR